MTENKRAFKVKWSKHPEHVCDTLSKLLTSEEFYDVTLACEGGTIKANKVVLAMCSPFFREMLQDNDCCQHYLPIRGIKVSTMKNVLEYLHTGQVTLGRDDLADFDMALECLKTYASIDIIAPCQGPRTSGVANSNINPLHAQHNDVESICLPQRPSSELECGDHRLNIKKEIVMQPEAMEDVEMSVETQLNVHKTTFFQFMHQNSFMEG